MNDDRCIRLPSSTITRMIATFQVPLLTTAFFAVFCSVGMGAPVTLTYEADFQLVGGSDPAGLDGAHLVLELNFADGQQYVDAGGISAFPTSHSLTISGASQASSNDSFTSSNGIGINFSGSNMTIGGGASLAQADFFSRSHPNNCLVIPPIRHQHPFHPSGTQSRSMIFQHLSASVILFFFGFTGGGQFTTVNESFSASTPASAPVPEPTSLAIWSLIGLGSAGLSCYRARRKKSNHRAEVASGTV